MKSIWSQSIDLPQYNALSSDIETEACVIGGGLAGLLTAYYLTCRGIDTVVLEADRIASGQTRNTTAKITSQHSLIYAFLIDKFGLDKAKQYAHANESAIEEYKRIVESLKIDCDFKVLPSYLYSQEETEKLQTEGEAAIAVGINAEFTTEVSLPFRVKGALKFNNQAQFNPLKFINGILSSLAIYENTRVITVNDKTVETTTGKVKAKKIIFATHYPFINMPGYYFLRMHQERSYVLALENATFLDGMYYGIDKSGLSFRNSGDFLLLGGGNHRTGENSKGGKYELLRQSAKDLFPQSREISAWSAQDCMTLDYVPYIGHYSSSTPNWYVATGFKKWGMTSSMVSAQIISDMITGEKNLDAEIFSPQRVKTTAAAKTLVQEVKQASKGISKQIFTIPKKELDDLPHGHGGIIEYEDEKIGAYKDDNGKIYFVSTKCPHLGCMLEWNPDEKSWDCPCHGSRFDFMGNLIDNPAQIGLDNKND